MPVRPRRGAKQRARLDKYEPFEIASLIQTGRGFLCRELDNNPDLLADAWRHHGEQFMPGFLKEWPGCRPFAWWRLSAPEAWPAIEQQFAEFDKQLVYSRADRASVAWRRFQVSYLRERGLMEPEEAAAAEKKLREHREYVERCNAYLRRRKPDTP